VTLERLRDAVAGDVPNAIMPLFWQKGGPVEAVEDEMERIADAGIGAVILEARPHPDFLQDGWFRDVDAIMDIARRRGMKVWFFDDDIFPTGHAAGTVATAPVTSRRRFLQERHTDLVGPAIGASIIVDRQLPWSPAPQHGEGSAWRVIAYRRSEDSAELVGEPVDLTDRIVDGVVNWDVPDGWWRFFVLSVEVGAGSQRHVDYVDYLSDASVQLLIDAVYERIWERYRDDFGTTIAGFFSDEPGLYNNPEEFDLDSRLGKPMPLPWNDQVAERLLRPGLDPTMLPLLWWPAAGTERAVRYAYMDVVSALYSENFSRKVGDWCRSRGVEYIGHVIEDNGAHARLGPGTGHYFRAMAGQDMAGVDIIGGQVVPGFSRGPFGNLTGAADGEFFHFGLAKLASSAAHLDPLKQGRSMCETIGAYGWYAGLRLFTWLTNHLLVRGVTHIVPHAFSPAPFPDPDCPPHFYAHGLNPQYRHHANLSAYTNRLSHLLQGGSHVASFAVLYHAEAEWLGAAMPIERPLRLLMEEQFDADVIPADALPTASAGASRSLTVGAETYDALIVPGSGYLPGHIADQLIRLADAGIPVLFVDTVPDAVGAPADLLRGRFSPTMQADLTAAAAQLTARAVQISSPAPSLRVYRVDQGEADVVLMVNESPTAAVRTTVTVPRPGAAVAFDAATATLAALPTRAVDTGTLFEIALAPGAALVAIVGAREAWSGLDVTPAMTETGRHAVDATWQVSVASATAYPEFAAWRELGALTSLSAPGLLPDFSGTARYEATFAFTGRGSAYSLDLGEVFEIAQVWLNGVDLGTRLAPPYLFRVPTGALADDNRLTIEVTNTLAKSQRDALSSFAQQDPTGLLGPVELVAMRAEAPVAGADR
jgi:hypothetical protein